MENRTEPALIWDGKDKESEDNDFILQEDADKSYGDPNSGNLLIQGDNLGALHALAKEYSGKIKCAYLDPPYNTGSTFDHYDDSISHCQWLSFMKNRLIAVKELLKPDGVIVVQIGFDEMAYLKVLMDEVFGREKCIGQIAVRMSHSAGMKRRAMDRRMIKNTEYILMYYRSVQPKLNPIYEPCSEYPVNYYQYITRFPSERGDIGEYTNLIDILYDSFESDFKALGLKKTNVSIKTLYSECNDIREFILKNKDRVVRKDSNVPTIPEKQIPAGILENECISVQCSGETYLIGKNHSGNFYQLYSIASKVKPSSSIGGEDISEALTNLVGDWWDGFYRDMSRVDIEGGVKMKTSKKPERLISRILSAVTSESDIVLDPFVGSGTTAAAALKMNRRFIAIELGNQILSLCLPRLKNVIDGKDHTGITHSFDWKGGSGFTFFSCACGEHSCGEHSCGGQVARKI
ncbi:MAG TPA: site-specific DNA-methyltransferase [Ruminiclostridium sp.]|nr:site-specific DNA-methyltransferase [Ruminiclostridium sp.]